MKRAGVPIEHCGARSKPEIVLADAGYGSSAPFRHALSERDLLWAVGLSRHQKVYPGNVTMILPTEKARKPRKHHIPDVSPVSAETALIGEKWRKISWRQGTKGPLTCLFAARRVRIADGPRHRVFDKGVERMPGAGVWVLGERRPGGKQKYDVSNLPAGVPLRTLAAAVKARWICEQAHRQLKEELGLAHFEGRSWVGLHRHALMTMIACAFLQSRRNPAASSQRGGNKEATAHRHSRVC